MGRTTYYFFFLPWLIICGATIVFDVAALSNFLYDLFNMLVSICVCDVCSICAVHLMHFLIRNEDRCKKKNVQKFKLETNVSVNLLK